MGREVVLLVFLILITTIKAPTTQTNKPSIEAHLRRNNDNGLTVVVQCYLGRSCSGCLINWYINGSAISGPDYVHQFREEDGAGSLTFSASSSYDGAYVSCTFRIPSEDNTFHNYSSDLRAIPLAVVTTTPVESVMSENILTTDKMKVEISVPESGSGQIISTETGCPNNTNEDLQPQWIIGSFSGITVVIVAGVIIGLIVLLCCITWKKRKRNCRQYDVNNDRGGENPEVPDLQNTVMDPTQENEQPDLENEVIPPITTQESEARELMRQCPTFSASRNIPINEGIHAESDCSTDLPPMPVDESVSSSSKPLPMQEDGPVVYSLSHANGDHDFKTFSSTVTSF